jgi:hypothetical protein
MSRYVESPDGFIGHSLSRESAAAGLWLSSIR